MAKPSKKKTSKPAKIKSSAANNAASSASAPAPELTQYIWPGIIAAQSLYAAAKLGIADHLADGAKTVNELANATNSHPPTLKRLLSALVALGVFVQDGPEKFRNTSFSETLRPTHPKSMRNLVLMVPAPFFWRPIGGLYETVKTGKPAFDRIFHQSFFEYLAEHKDAAGVFHAAMRSDTAVLAAGILSAYDFSQFHTIVDVGGGHGSLLQAILTEYPRMKGVLFDLPGVVASVSFKGNVGGRCEIVGGDFFDRVPDQGDAYILRQIIHDWNDNAALNILRNCHQAMHPGARLLLVETIADTMTAAGMMDLLMLVLTGGCQRAIPEFESLIHEAGFSLERVVPAGGPSIIECTRN